MIEIDWRKPKQSTAERPHYAVSAEGINGLAKVVAHWEGLTPNSPATAPNRVTITRVRRPGERAERGVTSPVLADAQPILTAMAQGIPEQTRGLDGLDPMDEVRERVRRMPTGPRANASAYYPHLLKTFRLIEQIEPHRPVQVLAEVTGKPESTLHLHLRKAREQEGS